jgi:rare lipoprotein A (peptidoglycan hydrolase)
VTTSTTSAPLHVEYGGATWLDTIPTGTCAENNAPMGATLLITTASGATATCRVVSRGPYAAGRIVDVAKATFALLASTAQGVVNVRVSW